MKMLEGWANFYVTVGSSAGAPMGLQFVVIALARSLPDRSTRGRAGYSLRPCGVNRSICYIHRGLVIRVFAIAAKYKQNWQAHFKHSE
jgi:hypothetical protein